MRPSKRVSNRTRYEATLDGSARQWPVQLTTRCSRVLLLMQIPDAVLREECKRRLRVKNARSTFLSR
jgi:hypothetical protein